MSQEEIDRLVESLIEEYGQEYKNFCDNIKEG